ncbi:MAG: FAD-binding protein [Burkholderiaceae bacterium]
MTAPSTDASPPTDPAWFGRRLRTALRGRVYAGPALWPVVAPADEADLRVATEIAAQAGVPVAVRGAGLDSPGATQGDALVLDCRRLDAVLEFDREAGVVEAQAGLSLAALDALLAPHGWRLTLDAPGRAAATLGGLVGIDAALRAPAAASIGSRLEAVEALLVDGTVQRFGPFGVADATRLSSARASALVSGLFEIAGRERDTLARDWPARVAPALGFRFPALGAVPGAVGDAGAALNLAGLLAGSRGSLAISRRIRLWLDRRPTHRRWLALAADSFADGLAGLAAIAARGPVMLVLFDASALSIGEGRTLLGQFGPMRETGALLLAEFEDEEAARLDAELERLRADCTTSALRSLRLPGAVAGTGAEAQRFAVAVDGLRMALAQRTPGPAATILPEDCRLPPARLVEAWRRIDALVAARRLRVRWFAGGHDGRLSLRAADAASARAMVRDGGLAAAVGRTVRELGGAIDGERLDPAARAALVPLQFGAALAAAAESARALFDPQRRLAPFVAGAAGPPADDGA